MYNSPRHRGDVTPSSHTHEIALFSASHLKTTESRGQKSPDMSKTSVIQFP